MGKQLCIVLILVFSTYELVKSQDTSSFELRKIELQKLKNLISGSFDITPDSSLNYINRGLDLAKQLNSTKERAWFISHKGILFFYQGYHEEATNLLFEAAELYKITNEKKELANIYINIGIAEKDALKKLYYYNKALDIYERENTKKGISRTYINIGAHYLANNALDSSLSYSKRALEIAAEIQDSIVMATALTNIALVGKLKENMPKDSILKNLKTGLNIYQLKGYGWGISQVQMQLAYFFYERDDLDSALNYAQRVISYSENRFSEIAQKAYGLLIKIKSEGRNFEQALQYQQKLDSIDKFIAANNNKNLTSLIEMEYQNKLEKERIAKLNTEMAKSRNTKIFAFSSFGILLIFSIIVFKLQKDRIRKKNELIRETKLHAEVKLRLADSELERSKLEQERLNEKLSFTNKELAEFASNIVQNSELLKDIQHKIKSIKTNGSEASLKRQLHDLSIMLIQMNNSDEKQQDLYKRAENISQDLLFKIRKTFPQLTENDVHLLVLIMLKFNSKEIGSIYNIELNSVHIKRHRLRKKLQMEKEDTFEDFIARHLPGIDLSQNLYSIK